MTLIGRGNKARDRWLSADYHTSLSTGRGVKCRPKVRKSLAMEADSVFDHESTLSHRTIAFNERCPDILSDHPKAPYSQDVLVL